MVAGVLDCMFHVFPVPGSPDPVDPGRNEISPLVF